MEVEPADARPASSASGLTDTAPTDISAQKRPRDPASGNMVSLSPAPNAPAMPASQFVICDDRISVHRHLQSQPEPCTTPLTPHNPYLWVGASSLQTAGPHYERGYSVSALQHKQPKGSGESIGGVKTTPGDCRRPRHLADPADQTKQACSSKAPYHTMHHQRILLALKNSHSQPRTVIFFKFKRQTVSRSLIPTHATHSKSHKLTPLYPPPHPQSEGIKQGSSASSSHTEEGPEEGGDPEFVRVRLRHQQP